MINSATCSSRPNSSFSSAGVAETRVSSPCRSIVNTSGEGGVFIGELSGGLPPRSQDAEREDDPRDESQPDARGAPKGLNGPTSMCLTPTTTVSAEIDSKVEPGRIADKSNLGKPANRRGKIPVRHREREGPAHSGAKRAFPPLRPGPATSGHAEGRQFENARTTS